VKTIDPEIQTSMNDYELGRADLGRCFNKYTGFDFTYPMADTGEQPVSFCQFPVNFRSASGLLKSVIEKANYDITGIQSHMKSGLNGHFLKNRFDTMADSGSKFYSLIDDTCNPFLNLFYFRSSTLDY